MSKTVKDEPMTHSCGKCKWWKFLEERHYGKVGACEYVVLFPDSTYARGGHLYREMREDDGRMCPCFTPKPKENENHE